jgi:nitroimidazol reductase NimA-like FMN-containing flavoprotein (pyridoxamine 5'-phosphate oxidase superfamily)
VIPRHPGDLERIERDECERLLASVPFVRLGIQTDRGPSILPVNHVVVDGDVYFRTEAGSKLATAAAEGRVAVETDGADADAHTGWSVLGHGTARIVTDPDRIESLLSLDFTPWSAPDGKLFWVQVQLDDLEGRRIVGGAERA